MNIGIFSNVNSKNLNRCAKQGTSVCSRTTRLKNNRVRSRKRAFTLKTEKAKTKVLAREMGSARQAWDRRRRPREGPELLCVSTFSFARWHMPRRKNQAARKWSPCGTENRQHHLSWKCAWVTGKAGENCQNSVEMGGTLILDKSVGSRCGDTLKASASFGLI